jgi:hypothetical protein
MLFISACATTPGPLYVEAGGYYLPAAALAGYEVQVNGSQLGVLNPAKTLIISISGVTPSPSAETPEQILERYLNAVITEGNGTYAKGPITPITVDEVAGVAAEITGTLYGFTFQGETFLLPDTPQHFLFGFGISNLSQDQENWETEGMVVFHTLRDSIRFLVPDPGGCLVSREATYGTDMANPIKIGGGPLDGPMREDAYLSILRGPNGEPLTYQSLGATADGELDRVEIQGLDEPVHLFLDKYNYELLRAPAGLTCAGDFLLAAP